MLNSPADTVVDLTAALDGVSSSISGATPAEAAADSAAGPPPNSNLDSPASTLHAGRGGYFREEFEKDLEGVGSAKQPFVVRFAPDDEENPLNFRDGSKWLIVASVASSALCVAFGSSVFSGGIAQMEVYFGRSQELLTAGLSLYVLGFALGPLIWAPMSEMYGRKRVFQVSYTIFTLFQIGCALAKNIETLLVCRWLAGFFGASVMSNSGAIVSDIFAASQRALGMSMYALAPFLGPVFGPIIGGFIGEYTTWRWLFWAELIFAGTTLLGGLLVPETYAPVLLRERARKFSSETGKIYVSIYDVHLKANETLAHKLRVQLTRPFILLFTETIVGLLATYAAIIYGTLYGLFGAMTIIFEGGRHWKGGPAGLAFVGIGIGMVLGIVANFFANKIYVRKLLANNGQPLPPEARLPLCIIGGLSLPIGLFWFAWTVNPAIHWSVCIIGSAPFGFGMVLVFLSLSNYLVDAYTRYAASALAANTVFRSLFGAAFPLFIPAMFKRLGNSWALTVFAFLTLIMAPVPILFMRFGPKIRASSAFAPGHAPPKLSKVPTRREEDLCEQVEEADLTQKELAEAEVAWEKRHDGAV